MSRNKNTLFYDAQSNYKRKIAFNNKENTAAHTRIAKSNRLGYIA